MKEQDEKIIKELDEIVNRYTIDYCTKHPFEAAVSITELVKTIKQLSGYSINGELTELYTLPDNTVFTVKMYNDLVMWTNFAHDCHYDKLGINQLRYDIKKLKAYIHKYGDMPDEEVNEYVEKYNIK